MSTSHLRNSGKEQLRFRFPAIFLLLFASISRENKQQQQHFLMNKGETLTALRRRGQK